MSHAGALQHLDALRAWLAQSLASALREAMAVDEPAGMTPGWQQACAYFGVVPIDDSERNALRAAQSPLRGAPVMEVAQVVGAIVRQARGSLHRLSLDAEDPAMVSGVEQLRLLLDRAEREAVEAYKRAVLPPRRGMFDRVLDHHRPGAPSWSPGAHILSCIKCGAPQLREREFVCPFCGTHLSASS